MNDTPSPGGNNAPKNHPTTAPTEHHEKRLEAGDSRSILGKVLEYFLPGTNSKEELIDVLVSAEDNEVIDPESRAMLEGVLRMTEMYAGDVLVAAPRMDSINIEHDIEQILQFVIETAHSRFPVYEGNSSNIIGILHAKDLLKCQGKIDTAGLRELLRQVVFIPESKPLNDVLREFRLSRNHLAIVIDEFGQVAGLITIEDVVEEIVGEIEDEFDMPDEDADNIIALPDGQHFRVNGNTDIEQFNEAFRVTLQASDDETFDTVAGLISHEMGHVPHRGESFTIDNIHFVVEHTKGGVVRWFKVWKNKSTTT